MAMSKRDHEAIVSKLNARLDTFYRIMLRTPSITRQSGRIKGAVSRYTLRVWFEASGYAYCILVHHHPGQSDSIIQDGELGATIEAYRDTDGHAERYAIVSMLYAAQSAHAVSLRPVEVA